MQKIYRLILCALLFMSCKIHTKDQDQTLKDYFHNQWEQNLKNYPEFATYLGENRYNDRLTDMSIEAVNKRHIQAKKSYDEILNINKKQLSTEYKLYYDLYEDKLKKEIVRQQFKEHLMPIDQMGGIQIDAPNLVDVSPFNTHDDYKKYLERLNRLPEKIEQVISLMKMGIDEKIMPPKIVLGSVPNQIRKQFSYSIDESPFYAPFHNFPEGFDKELQESLIIEGKQIIQSKIFMSFKNLEAFFINEYLPKARLNIAVSALPNGQDYYQFLVKDYTTTSLSIKEIHDIGLSEVERIHNEMEKIIYNLKFEGSFDDFLKYLRTNSRFYYDDAEQLLDGYRVICKKVDAKLPEYFMKLPRTPYGVKAIPEYQAPASPTAYYHGPDSDGKRAGYFWANIYQIDTRPKYEMVVLALHEAVPGHHLQIALANELENVPEFRKHAGYTAYIEGWALYAESLGEDMNMYTDPYDKFGQLTYEMWRACRLVIDTGIHAYGWSRDQAINYLLLNAAKTKHDAEVEIDRYIVWPGQALAYKIGELKIKDLKKRTQEHLKDAFDIREFHHIILKDGAIPLHILENKILNYIDGT